MVDPLKTAEAAKRVVAEFKRINHSTAAAGPPAESAVRELLTAGRTEEELAAAAQNYAAYCDREHKDKRLGAISFFSQGHWQEYAPGIPPPMGGASDSEGGLSTEEAQRRAKEINDELDKRTQQRQRSERAPASA